MKTNTVLFMGLLISVSFLLTSAGGCSSKDTSDLCSEDFNLSNYKLDENDNWFSSQIREEKSQENLHLASVTFEIFDNQVVYGFHYFDPAAIYYIPSKHYDCNGNSVDGPPRGTAGERLQSLLVESM